MAVAAFVRYGKLGEPEVLGSFVYESPTYSLGSYSSNCDRRKSLSALRCLSPNPATSSLMNTLGDLNPTFRRCSSNQSEPTGGGVASEVFRGGRWWRWVLRTTATASVWVSRSVTPVITVVVVRATDEPCLITKAKNPRNLSCNKRWSSAQDLGVEG
ncbi:hypothetical protein K439DRAFT_1614246 [Ramaria rubella]|nr:hypothetical protein K439DRAFT_1614246 [Ramaria rubella]